MHRLPDETQQDLDQFPLFSGLDAAQRARLAQACTPVALSEAQTLIEEGAINRDLYLLLEGRLSVQLVANDTRPSSVNLAHCGAGDIVGEYSLIDHHPASARVLAETPCRLLRLPGERLSALLDADPALAARLYRNLIAGLVQRLREKDAELDLFQLV